MVKLGATAFHTISDLKKHLGKDRRSEIAGLALSQEKKKLVVGGRFVIHALLVTLEHEKRVRKASPSPHGKQQ